MLDKLKKQSISAVSDYIRGYFARFSSITLKPQPPACIEQMVAMITAPGLGDTMMLTDLPRAAAGIKPVHIWARGQQGVDVFKFNPYLKLDGNSGPIQPFMVDVLRLREMYNLGCGHQLQQFRRAWRLPIDFKPSGCLTCDAPRKNNRVILHFDPSEHNSQWQRRHVHRRMRELYPENQKILENFISSKGNLEFVEVGLRPRRIKGAHYVATTSIADLIELIQTGSWFIGIMSGPLHIATALGLKCIVICNYPEAYKIVLPTLKTTGVAEEEWYYPQNCHLHQEDSSLLVPRLSTDSLKAAFNGDVYPFHEEHWLSMISE